VETMTFWAEYHGGFKGFSPNEFFEWEDSHPLCSNALSPSGSVMITIQQYNTYNYVTKLSSPLPRLHKCIIHDNSLVVMCQIVSVAEKESFLFSRYINP
jgi:hypothetical protein